MPLISRFNRSVAWLSWAALPVGWAFLDVSILRAGAVGPAHPWGWSWVSFLALNLGFLAAAAYTARLVFRPFLVSLSEQGLRYVSLRGIRQLVWASVDDIRFRGPLVILQGGHETVLLNRFCYAQPHELLLFLRRVLPPHLRSRVAA